MKQNANDPNSKSTYSGLWHYYFAGIWHEKLSAQALVCDYNNMGHADILNNFYGEVDNPSQTCPVSPNPTVYPLTTWRP